MPENHTLIRDTADTGLPFLTELLVEEHNSSLMPMWCHRTDIAGRINPAGDTARFWHDDFTSSVCVRASRQFKPCSKAVNELKSTGKQVLPADDSHPRKGK